MVYLVLLAAVLSYSLQNIPNKKYQQLCGVGMAPSLVLILTSGLISLGLFFCLSGFQLGFSPASILYAAAFALIGMTGTPAQLKAFELGSISTVLIYTLIGCSVIPFAYGALFLKEQVTVWKVLALVLMCVSFLFKGLNNGQGKKAQGRDRWIYLGCCLCCFFSNGICSILLKLNQITPGALSQFPFMVWKSLFSVMAAGIVLAVLFRKQPPQQKQQTKTLLLGKTPLLCALGLCITNGLGTVLSMTAASSLPSLIQFPVLNGGQLIFVCLIGRFLFHEKVSRREMVGVGLTLVSLVLFIL